MDHDVIGSEPDRAPRGRPAVRTVRLPDRLRRHRRTLVAEQDDGALRFDVRMQGELATVFFEH